MKLVSFLMPTRTGDLEKAVRSIVATCGDADYEILLRVDEDDRPRQELASDLARSAPIKIVIGPRYSGYTSMVSFVRDIVYIAQGKWCWLFDDDAWVEGNWQALSEIECDEVKGPGVNAEFYCLGPSIYKNRIHGEPCGMIVPTMFIRSFEYHLPVDQCWMDEARNRGWTFEQLEGVFYHHDGRPR